jgi:hypothetical protein
MGRSAPLSIDDVVLAKDETIEEKIEGDDWKRMEDLVFARSLSGKKIRASTGVRHSLYPSPASGTLDSFAWDLAIPNSSIPYARIV